MLQSRQFLANDCRHASTQFGWLDIQSFLMSLQRGTKQVHCAGKENVVDWDFTLNELVPGEPLTAPVEALRCDGHQHAGLRSPPPPPRLCHPPHQDWVACCLSHIMHFKPSSNFACYACGQKLAFVCEFVWFVQMSVHLIPAQYINVMYVSFAVTGV